MGPRDEHEGPIPKSQPRERRQDLPIGGEEMGEKLQNARRKSIYGTLEMVFSHPAPVVGTMCGSQAPRLAEPGGHQDRDAEGDKPSMLDAEHPSSGLSTTQPWR